MPELKILAIDQATKTGWCCGDDLYGEWNLKTLRDEDASMKLIRFRSKLIEVIDAQGINLLVYERTGGRFKNDIIASSKLVAVIEVLCLERGISYTAFSAKDIKVFATGKGTASKEMMIKAAKEKYGYEGTSDNTADAIHIYHYAKSMYK